MAKLIKKGESISDSHDLHSNQSVSLKTRKGDTTYEITKSLGKGAFGEVLQATNKETGSLRIVKNQRLKLSKLKTEISDYEKQSKITEWKEAIKNEAVIGYKMKQTYAVFFQEDKDEIDAFIVGDFYRGKDGNKIKNGLYSIEDLLIIIRGMFAAVYQEHKSKIIHGDIKLDNFIVNPSDLTVHLVDHGCSVFEANSGKHCTGAQEYSPRELLIGIPNSKVTDIYSLGICPLDCWIKLRKNRSN